MQDLEQMYSTMLESNRITFDGKIFPAAHHALAAAMYIAAALEDSTKLLEVEVIARKQHEEIKAAEGDLPTSKGDMSLSLYQSLLHLVRARYLLLSKS